MSTPSATAESERPSSKRSFNADARPSAALGSLACSRCRSRKVKCDASFPSCNGCSKAQVPCVIADSTASRSYTRLEIYELEERVRQLQRALRSNDDSNNVTSNKEQWSSSISTSHQNAQHQRTRAPARLARFVDSDGGRSFSRYIETIAQKGRRDAAPPPLPLDVSTSHLEYCRPHKLPSWEDAVRITTNYFETLHVEHPFLDSTHIWKTLQNLYRTNCRQEQSTSSPVRGKSQDLFQTNLVLALGSVSLFRNGEITVHPFGFFTAALQAIGPVGFSFSSIEDIENFLLIARFGLFYHIGCSIWELSQLCMQMCIELGLHLRADVGSSASAIHTEQRRRKIFWECYHLDRFASFTLGRPPGIGDIDIHTDFPYSKSSWARTSQDSHLGDGLESTDNAFHEGETDVFRHLLLLTMIVSDARDGLSLRYGRSSDHDTPPHRGARPNDSSPSADVYASFKILDKRLKQWLQQAPVREASSCLYHMAEYFELAYQKERLSLLRMTIDQLSSANSCTPEVLFKLCAKASVIIVRLYDSLRQRQLITYTRSYMHLIFSSGLIIICVMLRSRQNPTQAGSSQLEIEQEPWWTLSDDDTFLSDEDLHQILSITQEVLRWFSKHMPDTSGYVQYFDSLCSEPSISLEDRFQETAVTIGPSITTENPATAHDHLTDAMAEPGASNEAFDSSILNMPPSYSANIGRVSAASRAHENAGTGSAGTWFGFPGQTWEAYQFPGIEDVESALSGLEWDAVIPWNTPGDTGYHITDENSI